MTNQITEALQDLNLSRNVRSTSRYGEVLVVETSTLTGSKRWVLFQNDEYLETVATSEDARRIARAKG